MMAHTYPFRYTKLAGLTYFYHQLGLAFSLSKIKHYITEHTRLELTKKSALILIAVFTTIAIFDSSIVSFSAFTRIEPPVGGSLAITISFFLIFVVLGIVLLNSVRRMSIKHVLGSAVPPLGLKYFHVVTISAFVMSVFIILAIFIQIAYFQKYSIALLSLQTYLSHITSFVMLSFLVYLFGTWLASAKRNVTIMLLAIACSMLSINHLVTLLYLDAYFSYSIRPERTWYSLSSIVTNHPAIRYAEPLSVYFHVISLSSFFVMWIATFILLGQYKNRLGAAKYVVLMSMPLLYYVFPFQNYFGWIQFSWMPDIPVIFNILYIIAFSATKQVGALLFSIPFWTSFNLLHDPQVRRSILLSSIGMAIIFGSAQITPLQYRAYPPYGLITEAFIPLGAYALLAGTYTAATYVSQNSKLRKEFYKSASSQLRLLKGIGTSEMERELERRVRTVSRSPQYSQFPEEPDKWDLKEEDIERTLHDVLDEVYSKRKSTAE
jgi:hypothetical protein